MLTKIFVKNALCFQGKKKSGEKIAVPVMYEMKGFNSLFSSHYDHYYLDYNYFNNAPPDPSVFSLPNSK